MEILGPRSVFVMHDPFGGAVKRVFEQLKPVLDERTTRLLAAALAEALGRGGTAVVTEATGILRKRIANGRRDLADAENPDSALRTRIRRPGGGRKRVDDADPELIEALIEPTTRGGEGSPQEGAER